LSQFADLAAIAVANAELHAQITEFNQELERKVAVRSHELREARDEIAEQAEQLRSMLAKSLDVQEEERARIARDMHDGVIQLVNAARYELHAGKVLGGSAVPGAVQAKIDTAYQVLEEAEKEMRRVIYDLHPPVLDATGLAPALQKYARRFASLSGIACDMEVRGTPYRLPGVTEIAVFRMVEEALQNVAAHASAGNASVRLDYGPDLFCFWVQDDGIGFDYAAWMAERRLNHLGLLGMQERIQNLGGKMLVRSDIGRGTRVAFELPIVQEEVLV
jgi:two-component system sensor histidine kinase DegS